MERALDASVLRQQVIANNIANEGTPRFKRSEVTFESLLKKELSGVKGLVGYRTDPRHFEIGEPAVAKPTIQTDRHSVMNNNLNNVDIDAEMSLMAMNQLRYNVMIQQANHDIRMTRTAIGGR
ncbi:flagellar basal body rod protein FlgB [Paenibacillus thermoaerophilus]